MVDFLDTFVGEQSVENVPVGGTFTPTGLIGNLIAGAVWRLGWITDDLSELGVAFTKRNKSTTGKYRYYFKNRSEGDVAVSAVNSEFPLEMVWHFEMEKNSVLNFQNDEVKDKFSDVIAFDIPVKTPASAKYRHEFHLITLPYAVQASALASGLLTEAVFHTNELIMPAREGEPEKFTDEFQRLMIGDPESKKPEAMINCVLGNRRAELWSALGESNPLAYMVSGDKYAATSNTLKSMLRVFHKEWTTPMWVELVSVLDPRVDATFEDGRRNRLYSILRFFKSKADAEKAAQEQLEARKDSAPAATTPVVHSNGTQPDLPPTWVGLEKDFLESFKVYAEQGSTDAVLAQNMACTVAEVRAWKAYLGL